MEASTLQAPVGLARTRPAIGVPLLRLRSDEQLVALVRDGHDEAFRVIHDRYRKRLLAYTQQMLPFRHDAEDVLQDVFVRAYWTLRGSDRELALRAWLFRVAHNRCVDELRRPLPPSPEALQLVQSGVHDPAAEADRRESLRRLVADIRRLPAQQRSALLMRELGGMSYADLSSSLGISVGAVKSLLVRARIALAQAAEARDTACSAIREELVVASDRGVRPNAMARRHIRDCSGCSSFRRDLRGVNRQLSALVPFAPLAVLAKILGFSGGAGGGATASGGGGAAAGGAAVGGSAAASGGAAGGAAASAGALAVSAPHVATLLVAAVATAGGAVAIQSSVSSRPHSPRHVHKLVAPPSNPSPVLSAPAYAAAASALEGTGDSGAAKLGSAAGMAKSHGKARVHHLNGSGIGVTGGQAASGGKSGALSGAACSAASLVGSDPAATGSSSSTSSSSTPGTTGSNSTSPDSTSSGSTTSGSSTSGSTTSSSTTSGSTTSGSTTSGSTSSGSTSTTPGSTTPGSSTSGGSATTAGSASPGASLSGGCAVSGGTGQPTSGSAATGGGTSSSGSSTDTGGGGSASTGYTSTTSTGSSPDTSK